MISMLSSRQRGAIRLAWRFVAPYRGRVLGALLALMFTAAITLFMGQGIKLLVDQGLATQSPAALRQSLLLFFVLVLALAFGTYTRFYLVSWIGERVVADIRRRVFDHLIELHPGFYESNRSSEIQSRLTADTTLLQSVIGSSLSMALRNLIMLIGGSVLLVVTNPKLSGIVLAVCVDLQHVAVATRAGFSKTGQHRPTADEYAWEIQSGRRHRRKSQRQALSDLYARHLLQAPRHEG